jgi:hypothetical protein
MKSVCRDRKSLKRNLFKEKCWDIQRQEIPEEEESLQKKSENLSNFSSKSASYNRRTCGHKRQVAERLVCDITTETMNKHYLHFSNTCDFIFQAHN